MSNKTLRKEIKFTIIVPTRERAATLEYCLKTLVNQNYYNFEVLVSDNFSQDDTLDTVAKFSDPRLKYINTGKRISMSHNWEFALSYVQNGWVLFVGDDDGLLPTALQTLNDVIEITQCEAISAVNSTYFWPDHFASEPEGRITMPLPAFENFELRDSELMLGRVMKGLEPYRELPWLYNGGAASVNLINRLRKTDSSYFASLNPDIYSAVTLALGTRNYVKINIPIAINGASRFSGGTSHMLGQGGSLNSPASRFLSEPNIPFHSNLVFGKSLQIMVYECYLQASHLYHKPTYTLSEQIKVALAASSNSNYREIYAECLQIAHLNSLYLPNKLIIFFYRALYKFRNLCSKFKIHQISLSAQAMGAKNVQEAAVVISCTYQMFGCIMSTSYISRLIAFIFVFLIALIKYLKKYLIRFHLD
jgi:glycosyltransferase involved in cell wall biosynthesis